VEAQVQLYLHRVAGTSAKCVELCDRLVAELLCHVQLQPGGGQRRGVGLRLARLLPAKPAMVGKVIFLQAAPLYTL
jgi:hypothetical protein